MLLFFCAGGLCISMFYIYKNDTIILYTDPENSNFIKVRTSAEDQNEDLKNTDLTVHVVEVTSNVSAISNASVPVAAPVAQAEPFVGADLQKTPLLPQVFPFKKFTLMPNLTCDNTTHLVIGVCTALSNFELRQVVRETWGSNLADLSAVIKLVFVVGQAQPTQDENFQKKLLNESAAYNDMVQTAVVDHYNNLTLKSLAYFTWAKDHCSSALFVMKADDDIFLNVNNLLKALEKQMNAKRTFIGFTHRGAKPNRNATNKWYTSQAVYPDDTYPDYLLGFTYILTRDVIPDVLRKAEEVIVLSNEDVHVTGMLRTQVKGVIWKMAGVAWWDAGKNPCTYKKLVSGHRVYAEPMKQIWDGFTNPDLKC